MTNNIKYDKIIFTKQPKVNEILENQIDIIIKISPITINKLVKVIKILYYNTKYNKKANIKINKRILGVTNERIFL